MAIVGLLLERPSHQYDVVRRFGDRYRDVLGGGDSTVKRVIKDAVAQGLVERLPLEPDELTRKQPRHDYRATALGARMFREWVSAPPTTDLSDLAHRLIAARDVTVIGLILDGYEEACRAAIATLERPAVGDLARELIYDRKREECMAGLRWAEQARIRVARRAVA
jgi:DNA-binding PadR family transcriptional regulator